MALTEDQKLSIQNACVEIRDGCGRISDSAINLNEDKFKKLMEVKKILREILAGLPW